MDDAQKITELTSALVAALDPYLNGDCYDTRNPYSRPCVQQGLRTLGRVHGISTFGTDWMDVISKVRS